MRKTNRPQAELLSPAGSMETLKAVAAAGADAVYAAGTRFGARAYANNFTEEELLYAIDYLHLNGKRLYLTVNTLLKERELNRELYDYLKPLYQQGLDGVIIQDLGVLSFLKENFPGMELHASTQMNITGAHGAQLLKDMGCSRIVTARELSLDEIKKIHDTVDIEIESFIHGALCYCYSGQCLLSSILGGRSGNRGRCAQPCRLPYKTKHSGEAYLLSPKDLCTIELLPQILKSGVYSLKIEGRMKQAEYAAGVTSIYREYLDRCLLYPTEEYKVSREDLKRLEELGSRSGFTKGYYVVHNGPEMMTMGKPAHTKSNDALQEEMRERFLNQEIQEKIKGILILSKENPAKLVLQCKGEEVSVTGDVVQLAKSRPMEQETIEAKMRKTGGTGFVFGELEIQMENDIFIPVGALNQLRRDGIEKLREEMLKGYRREVVTNRGKMLKSYHREAGMNQREMLKGYRREAVTNLEEAVSVSSESPIAVKRKPMTENKATRSERKPYTSPYLAVAVGAEEQLHQVLQYPYVDRIYLDSGMFLQEQEISQLSKLADEIHHAEKQLWYVMPAIMRGNTVTWYEAHLKELVQTGMDGFVTGSYEGLQLVTSLLDKMKEQQQHLSCKVLADSSLYAWSKGAADVLRKAGADEITLPVEANERELSNRSYFGGELMIYGYLPLMVSAQCVVKNTEGCKKKPGLTSMTDRYGKVFTVKNQCRDCYNIIYNTSPQSLLHQQKSVSALQTSGYRISFVKESNKEIAQIMSYYEQSFLRKEKIDMERYLKEFTNGHFKRGVE